MPDVVRVDVVVSGDRPANELVSRISRRLENGAAALGGLVDQILAYQAARFEGQGSRWRRLARSTILEHRRHGAGAQPLVLTGALMRSLSVRGAPGQYIEITGTSLTLGTRLYYARFHKLGRGVPKRVPAGLTRAQRVDLVERFRALILP
jgi:hypothetical protein